MGRFGDFVKLMGIPPHNVQFRPKIIVKHCPQTNPYPQNPTRFKNQISPKGLTLTSWWHSPVTRKSNFHQSPDVFVGLTWVG